MADVISKKVSDSSNFLSSNNKSSPTVPSALSNVSYQDLLNANPYRNYEYKESGWQKFLSALGFRTGADAYRESMALNAAETDFGILQKQYNEQYDSAAANVERERAAGLNPDLVGADQGGSSSDLPEDANMPVPPNDDLSSIAQFGNQLMSCFTAAVGVSKDVIGLSAMTLANDDARMKNASSLYKIAQDIFLNTTSRDSFDDKGNNVKRDIFAEQTLMDQVFRPGSRKWRRLRSTMDELYATIPTEKAQFQSWFDDLTSRKNGYLAKYSSDYSDSNEVMACIGKYLGQFAKDTAYQSAYADNQYENNRADYEDSLDRTIEGAAINDSNELTTEKNDASRFRLGLVKSLNTTFDSLTSEVRKMSDRGNVVATCFLTLLQVLRLQMLSF